jgi:hypothetical protein
MSKLQATAESVLTSLWQLLTTKRGAKKGGERKRLFAKATYIDNHSNPMLINLYEIPCLYNLYEYTHSIYLIWLESFNSHLLPWIGCRFVRDKMNRHDNGQTSTCESQNCTLKMNITQLNSTHSTQHNTSQWSGCWGGKIFWKIKASSLCVCVCVCVLRRSSTSQDSSLTSSISKQQTDIEYSHKQVLFHQQVCVGDRRWWMEGLDFSFWMNERSHLFTDCMVSAYRKQ